MTAALPFRSRVRNCDRATAAPAAFSVLASRIVTADRLELMLRGEFCGTLDAAKRHARRLAGAVADRFGSSACAQITSSDGVPLFFVEARR